MDAGVSYARHLRDLLTRELDAAIAWALPWLVRRSLARKLHAVYVALPTPTLPEGGVVLAANHHSWWDGYLAWLWLSRLGRRLTVMMHRTQLARFPFFRHHGVIGHDELRTAVRRLRGGTALVIFPEGALRPPGPVARLHGGAAFLAAAAQVPLMPLAIRVLMRGAEHPEALLRLGEPLSHDGGRQEVTLRLEAALNALLADLDGRLNGNPEKPPPNCEMLLGGARSTHDRMAWVERLWTR